MENEEKLEEVIQLYLNEISRRGVETPENVKALTESVRTLYTLYQKDKELDLEREKLAYSNGRADLELRAKEQMAQNEQNKLELDQKRLDFEREKFQVELAIKEEANAIERERLKGTRWDQVLKLIGGACGTAFNVWSFKNALEFEATGVVGSFAGKKIIGTMLGKQRTEV